MRKSEMTLQQRQERKQFRRKLSSAKWGNHDPWNFSFEQDRNLTPEAQAEYESVFLNLRLSYYANKRYLLLDIVSKEEDLALKTRFYLSDNLETILDKVIAQQDTLSRPNYAHFIKDMTTLCNPIVIETPQGLVQVSL
ncbi:MAG: hypothetical protein ACPGWR_32375 [Ardenticatenaceae bacterium]